MTVTGYLDFCAQIRGYSGAEKQRRVDETIEKCFLSKVRYQTVSTLSKGFKQRVCFAQSILHDPPYLILDEPTDGLDPNQKHEVRLMIRQMSTEKSIIFSTHILDEVDAVCTRAIIIADGRIVADDTPENLRKRSPRAGAVSLSIDAKDPEEILRALRQLAGVNSASIVDRQKESISLRILPENPDASITDAVIATVIDQRCKVRSIFVEQGRLDEVFRKITTSA
jgi:ABC-2 type transport system ATP-binding protein